MDSFQGLIKRLIQNLNKNKIQYMFTGAIAVSYYGTPRTTMDVDIIVAIKNTDVKNLTQTLQDANLDFKEEQIKHAQKTGYKIMTINDTLTPHRVDVILSSEKLDRNIATIQDEPTYIQTPEALINAKLRMIKATQDPGKRAKDVNDVKSIMKYTQVNLSKIEQRAKKEATINTLRTIQDTHKQEI